MKNDLKLYLLINELYQELFPSDYFNQLALLHNKDLNHLVLLAVSDIELEGNDILSIDILSSNSLCISIERKVSRLRMIYTLTINSTEALSRLSIDRINKDGSIISYLFYISQSNLYIFNNILTRTVDIKQLPKYIT